MNSTGLRKEFVLIAFIFFTVLMTACSENDNGSDPIVQDYKNIDPVFREFYDLETDPAQMENIAAQMNPQELQSLSDWLVEFSASAGDVCRTLENEFHA